MKNKLPIIIAFSLPFILVFVLFISVFISNASIKPEYNFLYTEKSYYLGKTYEHEYAIVDSKITKIPNSLLKNEIPPVTGRKDAPDIFMYDVKNQVVKMITFEEARRYVLDPSPSSPDGYSIRYEYGHSGIFELFGSDNNRRGYFITKKSAEKKLEGISLSSGQFHLIGWIK